MQRSIERIDFCGCDWGAASDVYGRYEAEYGEGECRLCDKLKVLGLPDLRSKEFCQLNTLNGRSERVHLRGRRQGEVIQPCGDVLEILSLRNFGEQTKVSRT